MALEIGVRLLVPEAKCYRTSSNESNVYLKSEGHTFTFDEEGSGPEGFVPCCRYLRQIGFEKGLPSWIIEAGQIVNVTIYANLPTPGETYGLTPGEYGNEKARAKVGFNPAEQSNVAWIVVESSDYDGALDFYREIIEGRATPEVAHGLSQKDLDETRARLQRLELEVLRCGLELERLKQSNNS